MSYIWQEAADKSRYYISLPEHDNGLYAFYQTGNFNVGDIAKALEYQEAYFMCGNILVFPDRMIAVTVAIIAKPLVEAIEKSPESFSASNSVQYI